MPLLRFEHDPGTRSSCSPDSLAGISRIARFRLQIAISARGEQPMPGIVRSPEYLHIEEGFRKSLCHP